MPGGVSLDAEAQAAPRRDVTVRIAAAAEDRAGALEVRRAVFVHEQGVPEELEMDDLDADCIHLVALAGGRVIGAARLYEHNGIWHVGRVAVTPEWRKCSVGTRLMELAAKTAAERGARGLVLNAQIEVIPFYERLGYIAEGDPFLEAGIWHRSMRLDGP
ncbi:MAG TPA: MSMEG_0567/Sll0786 family nitrogen starvation N-acetyltransferase [Armatimonadota bacterium]|nr:MSMEG_0567/Sll0786 family nitrogen starvation N-acetyltransferase [Armatimonadota bacterium]